MTNRSVYFSPELSLPCHQWILLTKGQQGGACIFPLLLVLAVIWEGMMSMWRHCNVWIYNQSVELSLHQNLTNHSHACITSSFPLHHLVHHQNTIIHSFFIFISPSDIGLNRVSTDGSKLYLADLMEKMAWFHYVVLICIWSWHHLFYAF